MLTIMTHKQKNIIKQLKDAPYNKWLAVLGYTAEQSNRISNNLVKGKIDKLCPDLFNEIEENREAIDIIVHEHGEATEEEKLDFRKRIDEIGIPKIVNEIDIDQASLSNMSNRNISTKRRTLNKWLTRMEVL